jgi:hypothetical protein
VSDAPRAPETGQWLKGTSPNPGGRTKVAQDVIRILEKAGPTAANELVRLMTGAEEDKDRIAACKVVLEHLLGKPRPAPASTDETVNAVLSALLAGGKVS